MAIMHPSDIASRKHVPSEEKFFNACRDQLSDKYHVFFSVRWYSEENGIRIDSECDFLVFNPDYGYLCIECKGGKGIYADDRDEWYLVEDNEDRKLRVTKVLTLNSLHLRRLSVLVRLPSVLHELLLTTLKIKKTISELLSSAPNMV